MYVQPVTHNFRISSLQIDVVLRYDLGPAQRELFIREAKIMTGLQHEYIMKFYGAVILGSYADSVGLVLAGYYIFAVDNHSCP